MSARADVLVVGAGPAGLATAIRACQRGLSVEVLDAAPEPMRDETSPGGKDKACGEGLMPDALEHLRDLGVSLESGPTIPFQGRLAEGRLFRGIRYLDEGSAEGAVATGHFPAGAGRGVRRTVLHQALLDRARELGVPVRWGRRVTSLSQGLTPKDPNARADVAGGRTVEGRFLVAADGLHSRLRALAGLEPAPRRRSAARRFGVRRHFRCRPWADLVEVYWQDGCEAYVTPVGSQEVGVAILWSGQPADFESLLPRFPRLAARLEGAEATSRDRGAGAFRQQPRKVVRSRLALVGDAAGYLDPITGEGLAVAFHQVFALVEAMESDDLGAYSRAHRRIVRLPNTMTRVLLAVEARPWLRRRMIAALARDPSLFSRLLGIHARSLPPWRFGLGGALRLARGLVAAS